MILLNKLSLKLADLAPKQESRYSLHALHVTSTETQITDGHILVRVSHPKQAVGSFPVVPGFDTGEEFGSVLLPLATAKEVGKAIPTKQTIPILNHAALSVRVEDGVKRIQAATTDLDTPRVFECCPVKGTFPNCDAVMPRTPAKFTIDLDANLLGKIAKYAGDFGNERCPVIRLQLWSKGEPMRIDCDNENTGQGMTALIMPVQSREVKGCYPQAAALPDPFTSVPEFEPAEDVAVAV